MRRYIRFGTALTAAALIVGTASGARAFDQERKGFILGFGFGPGYVSADHSWNNQESSEKQGALTTNFKIGLGTSNKFLLYYLAQASWFNADGGIGLKNQTVSPGLSAVGVSYYFKPQEPSFYLVGGTGVASWFATRDPSNARTGIGALAGIGYEFRRYWHFEATIWWGSLDGGDFDVNTDLYALSLTFLAVGY